jgi:membrane-associated phospholipid phosphatase
MITDWKEALADKKYVLRAAITVVVLTVVILSLTNFLNYIETRQGIILPDPLLRHFKPINLTWFIFGLIYLSLIIALFEITRNPKQLIFIFQAYALLVLFRMAAMYLVPLNPPVDMIPLNDPFVQYFGTGRLLTKDLFFSGHTATLFLLFLVVRNKKLKIIFLTCTVAVALSVLLQHVHYSIDVLAAPFFTYTSYRIIIFLNKKINM